MKIKDQFTLGGRVALSDLCEGHIETTNLQNNKKYLENVLVSIRPVQGTRDYPTNGVAS